MPTTDYRYLPRRGGTLVTGDPHLLAGLSAWWSLDSPTTPPWRDETGFHPLQQFGTVPVVPGKIEGAASFNGVSGNFLERESPDNFNVGNPGVFLGFSGQAWVKIHALGADMSLFGNADVGATFPNGWRVMYHGLENGLAIESNDSDIPATERNVSDVETVLNQWHHVAFTVTAAQNSHIWVDGVERSDAHLAAFDTITPFRIGTDGANNKPANADIDEVALWIGRVFTDAEAAWLWKFGAGRGFFELT